MQVGLLYLLSHFECDSHTVQVLTQWCPLPPLTSTVKLSLFPHVHSNPLSLAARLHGCSANCSCYVNNGWTFSGQTSSCISRGLVYLIMIHPQSGIANNHSKKMWQSFVCMDTGLDNSSIHYKVCTLHCPIQ